MSLKEVIRSAVELETDYFLRLAKIQDLRLTLSQLEVEADRIKLIYLPLWYVKEVRSYYGIYKYNGIESGSWLLIRDDVDKDILKWADESCNPAYWSGEKTWNHPIWNGFYKTIDIGNERTPSKRYYIGRLYGAASVRQGMIKRLGTHTWSEDPTDSQGKVIYG